jgi:hypothetical protein
MSQIKILCSTNSLEAIALANRLDGELVDHAVCDRGHILCFDFAISTFGEQFVKAVILYPEFIEVIPCTTDLN